MPLTGRASARTRALVIVGLVLALAVPLSVAAAPGSAAEPGGGRYVPLPGSRLLDTRSGLGGTTTPAAGGTVAVPVTGRAGVPAGVRSVVLTVTVTAPTAPGYVTVFAAGAPRPAVSNLNFRAGETVPNLVVAPVGDDGRVEIYNGSAGRVQVLADLAGYFTAGAPSGGGTFAAVPPSRLLDTRAGTGGRTPGANGSVDLQVTGRGGVPSGAAAVVLNVTANAATAPGYVTVHPTGGARPGTSSVNFVPGRTVANLVVAPIGTDGRVTLVNGSAAAVQLLADVAGYFTAGGTPAPGLFAPTTPVRLLDTRSGNGGATPGARGTVHLQVTGRGGVPAGVSAVVLNVTANAPQAPGYVTAYADGSTRPAASNLNFLRGQTVSNLVFAPVGANGRVALYNGSDGATRLIADVSGYVYGAVTGPAPGPVLTTRAVARNDTSVSVAWTRADDDLDAVRVRRQTGAEPVSGPDDGVAVADDPRASGFVVDSGLTPGAQYTYTVFVRARTGIYSVGRSSTVTTPAAGIGWRTPGEILDPSTGSPAAISCPSPTFCAAVDASGNVLTFDGTSWTAPQTLHRFHGFTDVSCATPQFCMAVEGDWTYLVFDGTSWSAPAEIDGGRRRPDERRDARVSCGAVGSCTTVHLTEFATFRNGMFGAPSGVDPARTADTVDVSCADADHCGLLGATGTFVQLDHGRLGPYTQLHPPSGQGVGHRMSTLSCPTATYCLALDVAGDVVSSSGQVVGTEVVTGDGGVLFDADIDCSSATRCVAAGGGTASVYDGTAWSARTTLYPDDKGRSSVACDPAGTCRVLGTNGLVVTRTTTWSDPVRIDPFLGGLNDVSCASTAHCVAVDYVGQTFVRTAGTWTQASSATGMRRNTGLSCPTVDFCALVGATGTAAVRRGDAWSPAVDLGEQHLVTAVSCTGPTFCVAVADNGGFWIFDGQTWTAHQGPGLDSVSCVTPTSCVAIAGRLQGENTAWSLHGTSWTKDHTASLGTGERLRSVSCASATSCLAVSNGRVYLTLSGTTWTTHADGPDFGVAATLQSTTVSCAAADDCVAVLDGYSAAYDGASWTYLTSATVEGEAMRSIACPSSSTCVAVGSDSAYTLDR